MAAYIVVRHGPASSRKGASAARLKDLTERAKRILDAYSSGMPSTVGVVGDAGTREHDDADRHGVQQLVIAFEGRSLAMLSPVGLDYDLRDLAKISPAGGDLIGATRRAAMQEYHVQMLGMHLIELSQVSSVVVTLGTAGACMSAPLDRAGRPERAEG